MAAAPPNPADVADRASACDRYAGQLDQLIGDLTTLRRKVAEEWTGAAGASLCDVLDAHVRSVTGAQSELRNAATALRSSATP